ncbi:MAG: response regulator, partial [Lentisphaeria bacterium]|nr:response regulator [Lentisphaeria bacterium]
MEILVLDDDSDTLEILSHMLSTEDKHVETTTSPAQAMDLLARKSFHILLLDLKMPDMNGIEVLQRIREKDRDLAVIILTAYPSVETAVASLKGGVSDYVEKPIDKDKLLDAVQSIIRSKGLLRDPEESLLASVGAKIRVKRKSQELTLKQVARRTGLSVSLLS